MSCEREGCTCGCCEGTDPLTPATIYNRPGLERLEYRVGTQPQFLESMRSRLSSHFIRLEPQGSERSKKPAQIRPLQALRNHESGDFSIALLDGWATVADVLSFYQERIANEGYLRTATERRSVVELARLVGYAPRPGVAATAYLAYTLEKGFSTRLPRGTRAQSLPGQGELPQSFETVEDLQAHAQLNAIKPRLSRPQCLTNDNGCAFFIVNHDLYIEGTSIRLKPGDPVLVHFGEGENQKLLLHLDRVEPDPEHNRTRLVFQGKQDPLAQLLLFARILDGVTQASDLEEGLDSGSKETDDFIAQVRSLERLASNCQDAQKSERGNAALAASVEAPLKEAQDQFDRDLKAAIARIKDSRSSDPWIEGLKQTFLETFEGFESPQDIEGYAPPQAMVSAEPSRSQLGKLVQQISLKTPANYPRNKRYLERNIEVAFDKESHLKPQLLGVIYPGTSDLTLQALANTLSSQPSLQNLERLGVRAPLFGHNAPMLPRYNPQTGELTAFNNALVQDALKPTDSDFPNYPDPSKLLYLNAVYELKPSSWIALRNPELGNHFHFRKILAAHTTSIAGFGLSSEVSVLVLDKPWPPQPTMLATAETPPEPEAPQQPEEPQQPEQPPQPEQPQQPEGPGIPEEPQRPQQPEVPKIPEGLPQPEAPQQPPAPEIPGSPEQPTVFEQPLSPGPEALTREVAPQAHTRKTLTRESLIRKTEVFAGGEPLVLAQQPINKLADDITEGKVEYIELDGLYPELEVGRWAIVYGERTDQKLLELQRRTGKDDDRSTGVFSSELVMIAEVIHTVGRMQGGPLVDQSETPLPADKPHTFIRLAEPLNFRYKRDTVVIYGNVVKATHGETKNETLGSGDASKAFQTFALKQPPLTYIAAPTAVGAESTLELRANGIRWYEAPDLFGLSPTDRRYTIQVEDDGLTTVVFGDGTRGARLPSGLENIQARYRSGLGQSGNVGAHKITLPISKPLGVKEVTNPLVASGGADRESLQRIRRNAPKALLALDRLVSPQDYADFAASFAGIGKASATELFHNHQEVVHLTIAGADDIPISANSDLHRNLYKALKVLGDPYQPIVVEARELQLLVIKAKVRLLGDYRWDFVEPRIRAALLEAFGFEQRELGQSVFPAEVQSVIQVVEGVQYSDLETLAACGIDWLTQSQPSELKGVKVIQAALARPVNQEIAPAQLVILTPQVSETLILEEIV